MSFHSSPPKTDQRSLFFGFLVFYGFLVGKGTTDHHIRSPGLSRMHVEALGALQTRGIRGTAGCTEGAGLIDTGNGVTVDVAASLLRACCAGTAETRNWNLLLGLHNRWSRTSIGVVVVVVPVSAPIVIHLCQKLKAAGRDPDTGRLIVRIGSDTLTGFHCDGPAYGVEPGHHRIPRIVCQSGGIVTIRPVSL
jgi:hypothetical protein